MALHRPIGLFPPSNPPPPRIYLDGKSISIRERAGGGWGVFACSLLSSCGFVLAARANEGKLTVCGSSQVAAGTTLGVVALTVMVQYAGTDFLKSFFPSIFEYLR